MTRNKRTLIYWISQCAGWGLFVSGNILSAYVQGDSVADKYMMSAFLFITGILVTHSFRIFIYKGKWTQLHVPALVPRVLLSSVVMSFIFVLLNTVFTSLVLSDYQISGWSDIAEGILTIRFFVYILSFSALFLLWNIIYFAVHIFENWKKQEILNLELKASQTEIELNSFRAQMNPHFVFNSLNSIRALIDENPLKAKEAITSLSGIMRNNLSLGRSQTVAFEEELELVRKYLSLEKIRFEDRLRIEMNINPKVLSLQIPPFILQTIIENGIKHGISKRIDGGKLTIEALLEENILKIRVTNSGVFAPDKNGKEGIGIVNSQKRLQLLYNGDASLEIIPLNDEVKVELNIPQVKK